MNQPGPNHNQKMEAALRLIRAMAESEAAGNGEVTMLLPVHVIDVCDEALGDK